MCWRSKVVTERHGIALLKHKMDLHCFRTLQRETTHDDVQ